MATIVMVIGKSGSGKSTSLRNFSKREVYVINPMNKPLPFKNEFATSKFTDYSQIKRAISKCPMDSIVIDDAGYLITEQFMRGHSKMAGNEIYGFYNDIADNFYDLVRFASIQPDNKIIYFMIHEDKNDFGDIKPKTIGKLLDEKVCLEGMFSIVLRAYGDREKHVFYTQTDGRDVAKSPMDMFDQLEIDNDLKYVDATIRKYYEKPETKHEEETA